MAEVLQVYGKKKWDNTGINSNKEDRNEEAKTLCGKNIISTCYEFFNEDGMFISENGACAAKVN